MIFNVSQDRNVAVQAYKWDEGCEAYMYEELVEERTAGSQDDVSQAQIAKQLMEEYPQV